MLELKGPCARALAGALADVRPEIREVIMSNLIVLADRNYGEDVEEWQRWAARFP
ncbi:MAG: hypothetical protein R3F17_06880 [Planctomycetota bacterium]